MSSAKHKLESRFSLARLKEKCAHYESSIQFMWIKTHIPYCVFILMYATGWGQSQQHASSILCISFVIFLHIFDVHLHIWHISMYISAFFQWRSIIQLCSSINLPEMIMLQWELLLAQSSSSEPRACGSPRSEVEIISFRGRYGSQSLQTQITHPKCGKGTFQR